MGRFAVDIEVVEVPGLGVQVDVPQQGQAPADGSTRYRIAGRGRFEKPPPTFADRAELDTWLKLQQKRGLSVERIGR